MKLRADSASAPQRRSEPDDLAVARRVLATEAAALTQAADELGAGFVKAVDLMAGAKGRVVVSGIGKSGHIARKIAATFASTGTPAFFVHPSEASHGDLGMITVGDAVLALSNSGNTAELVDIISYTRRFGVPLIALTSGADSALSQAADVALILPRAEEACPMGLAPTTSTTLMLALGDALAVALIERKGFSAGDFRALHPGGQLGRRLLGVADIMHGPDELPMVDRDTPMDRALLVMTEKRFGCVGITDPAGRLVGIVTDGDLRRHMSAGLLGAKAAEIMTADPKTIRRSATAAEALGLMNANAITVLFVVDEGKPVGILHIHDCMRAGVA